MPGEFDFIEWVRGQQPASSQVPVPAGDDLAVMKWDGHDLLLVGVDQVLDGVHFDSGVHAPRDIGRKVMNRNLSDCAAMGCLPAAALASVALPRGQSLDYAKELYLGLREAADPFDCLLIGGDTATWDQPLALSVTILGRSAGVAPIARAGARPGDGLYVTGPLGGSILGRHMDFEPRVDEGRILAQAGVTAMIDISDGLSRDIRHICQQSGVGVVIDASAVPVHRDAVKLAARTGKRPIDHALHDGEDHELLFTSPTPPPLGFRIGQITPEPAILLDEEGRKIVLDPLGWEHKL